MRDPFFVPALPDEAFEVGEGELVDFGGRKLGGNWGWDDESHRSVESELEDIGHVKGWRCAGMGMIW